MMFSPLVNVLIGNGEYKFLCMMSFIAFAINIIVNLIIVPVYGGIGAALIVIITVAFINISAYAKIKMS
jgi:O-antigen/teichoic acid export membrane protein